MGNFETFDKREYVEPQCQCEKPMTNADRIRNFTDEELAEMLDDTYCRGQHSNCEGRDCRQCTLEWLQAEVKEGAE